MIKQTNMIMITTQNIINSSLPVSIYDCSTNKFSLSSIFRQISQIFLRILPASVGCLVFRPESHVQVVPMPIIRGPAAFCFALSFSEPNRPGPAASHPPKP